MVTNDLFMDGRSCKQGIFTHLKSETNLGFFIFLIFDKEKQPLFLDRASANKTIMYLFAKLG